MKPFFSIITPVLNSEKYIKKFIYNLKLQNCDDWESIIIDDFSTDNSLALLKQYTSNDKRFKILIRDGIKNTPGPYQARNTGLEIAQGKYILFLDIDDSWTYDNLKVKKKILLKDKRIKLIFGPYTRRLYKGKSKIRFPLIYKNLLYTLNFYNPIPMCTSCVDKNLVKKIRFRSINHEDYFFWIEITKFLQDENINILRKSYSTYYLNPKSLSSSKIKSTLWVLKIFIIRGFGFFKIIRYFIYRIIILSLLYIREEFNSLSDKY